MTNKGAAGTANKGRALPPSWFRLIIARGTAPGWRARAHSNPPAMYLIYSLLFTLGAILTAPYYLWRQRGHIISGGGWRERFGFLPPEIGEASGATEAGAIWVHAVSVGETLAIAPLVRELQRRYPERRIFLSHVTYTGREAGESRLPGVAGRFYLPLDWAGSARRAVARIRPALVVIVETELWPNLLRAAHESGARVVLVNARLSDRSFRGYRRVASFMRRVLECVDWIAAQSPEDAERFRRLGARPDRVAVAGNVKFDSQPPQSAELVGPLAKALRDAERRPVVVAASTMPGEEAMLAPAWQKIREQHPQALMILAPRHPARFDQVAELLAGAGFTIVRRTALAAGEADIAAQLGTCDVLLLDTIGELAGIFALADVVFVGGSLVRTGGHNVLEPAYWSKAIVFGPHMENFRDVSALFLGSGAAVQVRDARELSSSILKLLQSEAKRQELGAAAKQLLGRESGATGKILEHLGEWLDVKAAARPAIQGSRSR
jgi:3-deoxy-D-manno-octulosonic-acid transferase